MKFVFTIVLLYQLLPTANGQSFASVDPLKVSFARLPLSNYEPAKHHDKRMLIGGIIAGTGGLIALTGVFMIAAGTETSYDLPPDTGLRDGGIVVAASGFIIAMAGGIIARRGIMERRYGLKILSRRNEVGLAYNF